MNSLQLIEVNKAIDVCLVKVRQKPRALRNYHRLVRQGETKLVPRIKEWMGEMIEEARAGLSRMRGKTATQKTKSIADWSAIKANGVAILKPTLLGLLGEGGKAVVERRIVKQQRFDTIGIEAVAWADAHTASLVAEIVQETMAGIRDVITTGINAGRSIPTIARELRPIVGLSSQYAGAVANFQTKLLAEGVAAQRAAAKAATYAGRLHRRRAQTIARTETGFALSEGQRQGYTQMGVKRLERVEDPECCDICAEYNGKIYSVKEAEGVLPEHPNCEGTWVAASGEKVLEQRNFRNNITAGERKIVEGWSEKDYLMTRKYLRAGEIERENLVHQFGAQIKEYAETMEKLFLKYKDGVSGKTLYRGISNLSDDVYSKLKQYKKGDIAQIDKAISSWSTDSGIVDMYATSGNNVKFHLQAGRKATLELDVSSFSATPHEKEIILNTHKFKVTKVKEEIYQPHPRLPAETTLHVYLREMGL